MKKPDVLIAPSIIAADQMRLGDEIKAVEKAGCDIIHIDIMDGCFVPNITLGASIVAAVKNITTLPLDCHLMIVKPDRHIESFIKAGADMVSVHAEVCQHLNRTLAFIKQFGIKAGVALNPATGLEKIEWVLDLVDFVLIMSVNPGFYGQKFLENSIEKTRKLRTMIDLQKLSVEIEMDGGIDISNSRSLREAGCSILVSGAAIFKSRDYGKTIDNLRK
jgi:ribulose-phosphate 3-epimerase